MAQSIDSVLSNIGFSSLIHALILLKPEPYSFREENLEEGLRKASEKYKGLSKLFKGQSVCDGTSPTTKATGFEHAFASAERTNLIYPDPAWLHLSYYHIRDNHRNVIKNLLQEDYGEGILDVLKPVAELVWDKVKK